MNTSDIVTRIGELQIQVKAAELVPGTTSLLALVYGEGSPQLTSYAKQLEQIHKKPQVMSHVLDREIVECSRGTLRNLKREIEGRLTGNLRQQITGEVLTDLVQFSRTVLVEQGDWAKNVAAVLAAAAFEDSIRRMGKTLAGVIGQGGPLRSPEKAERRRSDAGASGWHSAVLPKLSQSCAARELG